MRPNTKGDGVKDVEAPSEGAPVIPLDVADTGRLSTDFHGRAMMDVGTAEPIDASAAAVTPDAFLEALANKVVEKIGDPVGGGGGSGGGRKFLGMEAGAWTKLVVGYIVAGIMALVVWQLTIRDALGERPTKPQVEASLKKTFDNHNISSQSHPPIQAKLKILSTEQRTIRESQIRQEGLDREQNNSLKKIEKALTRGRR